MYCDTYEGDIYMICAVCARRVTWEDRTESGVCKKCAEKKGGNSEEKEI